jgi:hypothetical protein
MPGLKMTELYRHNEEALGKVAFLFVFGLFAAFVVHNVFVIPKIGFGPFEDPERVYWNASNWWGYASRTGFWAIWGVCLASLIYLLVSDLLLPRWLTALAGIAIGVIPVFLDFAYFAHSHPQVVLTSESLTLHMPARTIHDSEQTQVFHWKDVRRIHFEEVESGGNFGNFAHASLVVTAEQDFHFEVPFHVKPDTPECKAAWKNALSRFAPHVELSL